MRNIYKRLQSENKLGGLLRISAILMMIMVWILIDKGNVYGQESSVRDLISKTDVTSNAQTALLRELSDDTQLASTEDKNQFVLMPNPFTKELVFDFEFTIKTGIPFEVICPLGRLVQSGQFESGISTQHLDLSHLQNGMYLIRLNMGDRVEVRRVIKK